MKKIYQRDDYNTNQKCTWCPGCGNFAIWYMLKQALFELKIDPHNIVIVYGVGCSGNGANFTDVYAFHGLHGRALPVAQGIKLVNKNLKVIVMAGDGDSMGIGIGHFIHACRRNMDITLIMHDNQIYGLTTGQLSPRSDLGMITKTSPTGNFEPPVNPIALAISSGATFVARGFSGHPRPLKEIFKAALMHKGFSFVDVLQPCITFNKLNTYAWYNSRAYYLQDDSTYDVHDFDRALSVSFTWGEKIPLGIFYKSYAPTYEDSLNIDIDVLQSMDYSPQDISDILKNYEV